MQRRFQLHRIRRIENILGSNWGGVQPPLLSPCFTHACGRVGTGFTVRHGLTAIQSLFTGTIAKVASLVAIVIGGYGFAHGGTRRKKGARLVLPPERALPVLAVNVLSLALGRIAPFPTSVNLRLDEGLMPDKAQQKHRTNRVFKSLHKAAPPIWAWNGRSSTSSALVRWGPSISSIPSSPVSPYSSGVCFRGIG